MKRLISLVVSLIILAIIYWKIDFQGLIKVLANCNPWWMAISLGMVIPLTMFTAWRLQQLMPSSTLGFGEANRLILAASVLNMVLPSKMGDIAKAYFLKQRGHLDGSLSLSLVVFEKTCDLLSLLLWCVFGLCFYRQQDWWLGLMSLLVAVGLVCGILLLSSRKMAKIFFLVSKRFAPKKLRSKLEKLQTSWGEMHDYFWRDQGQLLKITITSIFIWFLHLLQIWLFILALNAWTPFLANLALSPLAILAGLLPLTFAGVGTRDAALIWFYQPYLSTPIAAALGLLCTSRYLLPAIGGLPFLGQYLEGGVMSNE
ncbi:MAG: flippase-like domain-containing protein [Symploca sp. SIO2E6]|nr:flippase-like domain-containing protein [Symploca sp. SIO2E6]